MPIPQSIRQPRQAAVFLYERTLVMDIKLNKPFSRNSHVDEFDVRQMKKTLNRLGYYQPPRKTGITGIALDEQLLQAKQLAQ